MARTALATALWIALAGWTASAAQPHPQQGLAETPSHRPPFARKAVSPHRPLLALGDAPDSLRLVKVAEGLPDTLALVELDPRSGAEGPLKTSFKDLQKIEFLLRDESPEDGIAGAGVFASHLLITWIDSETKERKTISGKEIGFLAFIEGGFRRTGFIIADGNELIRLSFSFIGRSYPGPTPSAIVALTIYLTLAYDYQFEVFVNDRSKGTVGSAGNIKDGSNLAAIRIALVEESSADATAIEPASWGQLKEGATTR